MATPTADTYNADSGASVYAGRYETPAWLSSIAAGEWGNLPSSTLSTSGVGWAGTSPGGTYLGMISWGGACLNTVGCFYDGAFHAGIFLIRFGGGHSDWGGNDVLAYGPINSDSAAFHRLTDPTIPPPSDVIRASGKPVSRHGYDTLVYLPTLNKMLCIAAPGSYVTGNALNGGELFDFAADPGSTNPWAATDSGFPAYYGSGQGAENLISDYNPTTNKAYGWGYGNSNLFGTYDVATDAWSSTSFTNGGGAGNSKGAIDPVHNIMVGWSSTGGIRALNLASPTGFYTPTITGTGPGSTTKGVLEWDTIGQRFLSCDLTGKTMYFLTPGANPASGGDAWVWTSATPAGGVTPAAAHANGVFGAFRYVQSLGGVIYMPTGSDPISFYKF